MVNPGAGKAGESRPARAPIPPPVQASPTPDSPTFRRRSLRLKLVLLVAASVSIAVALMAGASAWRDGTRETAAGSARLSATASVIASLSAEAAAQNDRPRAFQALRSMTAMPGVLYARIDRADGSRLVETGDVVRLKHNLEVSAPITYDQHQVGRVVLLGRSEGVLDRLLAHLQITLLAALAAMAAGLIVAWRMQRGLTRPIRALTRSMAEVRADHRYDRSVDIAASDEIGELVAGFNAMLGEIRDRDRRIADHVAGLEGEVAARTSDLREARDAAEEANGAKSDFLATMSHEIRTPMNGMMVMAEMLAAGEMPPRQRRFAEVIAKSGSSLIAIINDILDFSKIEAGKLELETVATDVSELAEDVSSLFWEKAASKGLDLAVYVDPATPKTVEGDPTRLRQLIGALVNNAIKFTETGGVLIEVEPDSSASLRISVRDTGVGIPKDKLGEVFGAFSQADQSTTRRFGGTGLGLSICKRLVEAMGGRFNVTSDVGKGSTFAFRIPVIEVEAAPVWPSAPTSGARVRIAHEGVSTRRALSRYLARAGYRLAEPEEAADLVLAAPSALTRETARLPTICLAEYGDSAPHDLLKAGAAHALMVQPFRRGELEALLRQLEAGQPLSDTAVDAAAARADDALPGFPGAHVLVADDSAVNREVAMEALSRLQVRVSMANDGRQALEKTLAERFDLVLMDGSMPEMDGYEATRELRKLEAERGYPRTPIVALTAHVVGSAAEAWREAGMDAVLHKPFTLAGLANCLATFIEPGEAALIAVPIPPRAPSAASRLLDPEVQASLADMAASGKADFVAKVQDLYRDKAPGAVAQLIDAARSGLTEEAAKAAHALKSMSLNIGAREVTRRAADMEQAAREGQLPSPEALAELEQVLTDTLAALSGPRSGSTAAARPPVITTIAAQAPPEVRALLQDLEQAMADDQLSLVYQPQMDRDGQTILGVETLVRWTHPIRGFVSPADFIPLAEAWGSISRITDWVMRRAMVETGDIQGLQVGFNASALEFTDQGIVSRIQHVIEQTGFDPRRLEVEITETAILENESQVRENMNALRAMGMKVALDDFGAGYSSLGHLRRYPFDKLKIDREFVIDCTQDVQSATVVHAVVSIGRALGMKVVAEGVETEQQRQFLRIAGVHAMQGFLFGKPMTIDALKYALASGREAIRVAG